MPHPLWSPTLRGVSRGAQSAVEEAFGAEPVTFTSKPGRPFLETHMRAMAQEGVHPRRGGVAGWGCRGEGGPRLSGGHGDPNFGGCTWLVSCGPGPVASALQQGFPWCW